MGAFKMKKIILTMLVLAIVVLAGCTQTTETDNQESKSTPKLAKNAICGNGIQEQGETHENCCLDVACPEFFNCKELTQGEKVINTCVKAKLEETAEYKKLIQYWEEESWEYSKESDLINYDSILTKINQMNRTVTTLSTSYDVSILAKFVQYRYERREWNVQRTDLIKAMNKESNEDKQKQIFAQIIELDKGELARLNSFENSQISEIDKIFNYDIFERGDSLKSQIKEYEDALNLANKNHEIELSIIDYNPKCYSWSDECFLDYVKINIKNVGEIALQNPTFDFYIQKADSVKTRDIDEYDYNLNSIPVGYNGVFKATYIGYDGMSSLPPGSYTLKVNLKQGVSTKVIASATTSITLR